MEKKKTTKTKKETLNKEWNKMSEGKPKLKERTLFYDGKNVQIGEFREDDVYLWFGDRWKKNMLKLKFWKPLKINLPR